MRSSFPSGHRSGRSEPLGMETIEVFSADRAPETSPVSAAPLALSTMFTLSGAIALQNPAARKFFASPGEKQHPPSAFSRDFVDRALARNLSAGALAGIASRLEPLIHTRRGVSRLCVEVSPATSPRGGRTLIALLESPIPPPEIRNEAPPRAYAQTGDSACAAIRTDITTPKERGRLIEEKSKLLGTTLGNMDQGMLVLDA